jgi:hypothetical protein
MTMQQLIIKILKRHLIPEENFIYGFADLTGLLSMKFNGFNYGISIGRKLDDSILDNISEGPTMEYYYHYRKVNEELALLSGRISADLNEINIETLTISPTVSTEELDTIYFKTLRRGLARVGKQTLGLSLRPHGVSKDS